MTAATSSILVLLLAACRSGGAAPAATTPDIPTQSAPTAASPTPDPIANPNVDADAVYDNVRHLSVDIGPRVAGSPGEERARDFLADSLRSYGYQVDVRSFPFDASFFLGARLDVGPDAIAAVAFKGSAAGTTSGVLVPVGTGGATDMPSTVRGNIALMQRGGMQFSEMVQRAVEAGATGVIIYNNAEGNLLGQIENAEIPVVSLTQADGERLAARAAAAPVQATIVVSPPRGTAYNVVAMPENTTTCATITGGHYDSVTVTGGADDNASGAAAVLEVARLVAARKLTAENCFVLFSAEEFGLIGSHAFVDALSPEALAAMQAMLNLDVVGVSGTLGLVGDAGLVEQARVEAQKVGVTTVASSLPPNTSSDHAVFRSASVPVVMFTRPDNLIHSPSDAIDRIDRGSLSDTVTAALALLTSLTQ